MTMLQLSVHNSYSKDNGTSFITVLKGFTPAITNSDDLPLAPKTVTYRIKLSVALPIGKPITINLDNYEVNQSVLVNEEGEVITYKWLNPKQ